MRVLFMGTAAFAVPSLRALLDFGHEVIGVVTQPDRPSGRGLSMRVSPVKEMALAAALPIHQPENVRSEDFLPIVRDLLPDVSVVAAFGQIIPEPVLSVPRYGSINVHASLLPKYRGAAPVHHALFNGETTTGVTTMLMDPGLDTGPILLQKETDVLPDDDEGSLEARLADLGASLLIETLDRLEAGTIVPIPQDDTLATHARSVRKADCALDWRSDSASIVNKVRGCSPRPGAYTSWKGLELKVWSSAVADSDSPGSPAGEVIGLDSEGILVKAGGGTVLLTEVQPANRKRMWASEFARGYGIQPGSLFE